MAKRRKSKDGVSFSDLVRKVLDCIPKAALVDITRDKAIKMVAEKNPRVQLTTSRKNQVGVLLNNYKNETGKPKFAKSQGRGVSPWLKMEAWEIALQCRRNCGGDLELTKAKLREVNACLTKIRCIERRSNIRVRSAS